MVLSGLLWLVLATQVYNRKPVLQTAMEFERAWAFTRVKVDDAIGCIIGIEVYSVFGARLILGTKECDLIG